MNTENTKEQLDSRLIYETLRADAVNWRPLNDSNEAPITVEYFKAHINNWDEKKIELAFHASQHAIEMRRRNANKARIAKYMSWGAGAAIAAAVVPLGLKELFVPAILMAFTAAVVGKGIPDWINEVLIAIENARLKAWIDTATELCELLENRRESTK